MISVDVERARAKEKQRPGEGGVVVVGTEQCFIHEVSHSRGESAETTRRKPGTNGAFWKTDTFHVCTFSGEPPLFQVM